MTKDCLPTLVSLLYWSSSVNSEPKKYYYYYEITPLLWRVFKPFFYTSYLLKEKQELYSISLYTTLNVFYQNITKVTAIHSFLIQTIT